MYYTIKIKLNKPDNPQLPIIQVRRNFNDSPSAIKHAEIEAREHNGEIVAVIPE